LAQAKQKADQRTPLASHFHRGLREGALFIFGFLAIYFLIALVSYNPADPGWSQSGLSKTPVANLGGPTGAWFADVFLFLFGYLAYLFPLMVGYAGWLLYQEQRSDAAFDIRGFGIRFGGFLLTLGAGCALASMHDTTLMSELPVNAGGSFGDLLGGAMEGALGFLGATLLLLALFFTGVTLFTHLSWLWLMDATGGLTLSLISWVRNKVAEIYQLYEDRKTRKAREEKFKVTAQREHTKQVTRKPPKIETAPQPKKQSERVLKEKQVPLFSSPGDSVLPPLARLDEATPS
jgi:S-DNA-T family DNA segregation ATPase FtsK/SpoIIIE